ncbi:MAG: hypothetical protein GY931_19660 [Maribacter sp.]|nr:hypothetical protein [Maribacter sp.]
MQYIGETKRTLRTRMNEHRNKVAKKFEGSYLVRHFSQENHSIMDMKFAILEKLDDKASDAYRLEREDFWIKAMVTAYPFGMNDKIKGYGIISKGVDPMSSRKHPYFCIKFPARVIPRGKRKRTSKKIDSNKVKKVVDSLKDSKASIREKFIMLAALSNKAIHLLTVGLQSGDLLLDNENALLLKAMAAYKLGGKRHDATEKPKIYLPVSFPNKGMESIQLHTVFKDRKFQQLLCPPSKVIGDIMVSYQYKIPIGSTILNHGKFLRALQLDKLKEILDADCDCATSQFLYRPAMHVVTGDSKIVEDVKLRKIIDYGTKYRVPEKIDWDKVWLACKDAINLLQHKICTKFKIVETDAEPAFARCLYIIRSRIRFQKLLATNQQEINIFGPQQKINIARLQKSFIIAPADKAGNNYIFVCKKYYLECLCKELGVKWLANKWTVDGNAVYKPVPCNKEDLLKLHDLISGQFNASIDIRNKTLPMIFAVPKLHKNPYKFRYISGASKSSMRPLSILLNRILKHLKQHFRNYCNAAVFAGSSMFWSIDSSLEALHHLRNKRNVKKITTADFSTLYTCLPHKIVEQEISFLVHLLFKNAGKKYLCIGYTNCFYSDEPSTKVKAYTEEDIMEMVQVVLDNTYVQFAGLIFKQCIGIPMGGNASPLLADLSLAVMEFKYLKQATPQQRKDIGDNVRYIDDLLNANGKSFLTVCKNIYPASLLLEDTTSRINGSDYLDLSIEITGGRLNTTLYNKTDAFNFMVIRYPEASSNVHSCIGYNTFYSQLLRIGRICSSAVEFENKVEIIWQLLCDKGYDSTKLLLMANKFVQQYKSLILGFGYSNSQIHKFFKTLAKN